MTIREQEVLEYIINFKKVNGFSPTIREIARGINTKSTTHVKEMIDHLSDLGYISIKQKSPRTIVVKKFI